MPFLQSQRQSRVDPRCFAFLKAAGFDSSLTTTPALKDAWLFVLFGGLQAGIDRLQQTGGTLY